MEKNQRIEISSKTIIFTILFFLFLKFIWLMKDLVFSLVIAFIIMSAVRPVVAFLEKKRIPRPVSASIIFLFILFSVVYLLVAWLPPTIFELSLFLKNLPFIIEKISPNFAATIDINALANYLPNITNQIWKLVAGFFSNTVFVLSTFFFSFYFTIEENFIKKLLIKFASEDKAGQIADIFETVERRLGRWVWGELILMLVVGFLTYIGLILIGIKYALPLAVVAGLLEVVPNLGPVVATVPAVFVTLSQSYLLVIPVVVLYFVVQQLENNLIVPYVMKKAVGLHPIITLLALIVGGRVGGVLGILLAVPITIFLETILIEVVQKKTQSS